MKGLLYRDWIMSWDTYKKNFLLILVLYGGIACFTEQFTLFSCIAIFCTMYVSGIQSFDEYSHWNIYARTLPVSKGSLVAVKYLLTLIWIGISDVAGIAILLVISLVRGFDPIFLMQNGVTMLVILFLSILYSALSLTLSFKYGVSRARLMSFLGLAVIFVGGGALLLYGGENSLLTRLLALFEGKDLTFLGVVIVAAAFVLMAVLYLGSWAISTAIYKRKEY